MFLYESGWDLLVALLLIYLIGRLALTGDRALALCAGLYAAGRLGTASARIGGPAQLAELEDRSARRGRRADRCCRIPDSDQKFCCGPEILTTGLPRRRRLRDSAAADSAEDMQPSPNAARGAGMARPGGCPLTGRPATPSKTSWSIMHERCRN